MKRETWERAAFCVATALYMVLLFCIVAVSTLGLTHESVFPATRTHWWVLVIWTALTGLLVRFIWVKTR